MERLRARAPARSRTHATTRAVAFLLLNTQLFWACAPLPPLPAAAPEREQTVSVGDILRIEVWRQPEFSGEFEIGTDSVLVHPLYQDVKLAGLPIRTVRDELATLLATYVQAARVVVEPLYSVAVAGEVRQPGMYHVGRGTTVAEVLALAGGPTVTARLDRMRLIRDRSEYGLALNDAASTYGVVPVLSGDQILVDRRSQFSVWRDIIFPVSTLAALVLTLFRLRDATTGN